MTRACGRSTRRANAVVAGVAVVLLWGCSSSDRPSLESEPPGSTLAPSPASDDTTPESPDHHAVGDSAACALLSDDVLDALGTTGDTTTEADAKAVDDTTCAIRTADGTVHVERRDGHADGISGAIPQYHASRRDVPLRPVGDASPPMLWAELDDSVELAVFADDATVVYRFPSATDESPELLDAVVVAVTAGR